MEIQRLEQIYVILLQQLVQLLFLMQNEMYHCAGQISITDITEVTQFMNFNDALNYCRNTLQKDMISFHSAADFAAVESQLSNANQAFWIGCTNPVQDASNNIQNWVWTDGHIFGIIQYQDQLEHIVVK